MRQRAISRLQRPEYRALSEALVTALVDRGRLSWREAKNVIKDAERSRLRR